MVASVGVLSRPAALDPARPPRSVALYLPHLRFGGAERAFVRLAQGFAWRGRRVWAVTHRQEGELLAELPPEVERVGLAAGRTMAAVMPLARFLRHARPDVLVSGQPHNNMAALLARRLAGVSTRVIVSEHAPLTLHARHQGGWKYRAAPGLAGLVYPRADAVVAVSEGVAGDLRLLLRDGGRRLRVIHNPAYPSDLPSLAGGRPGHRWLAPGQRPVIVGVGRLSPEKDFATLVRAAALLRRERPLRLLLLGDGPERDRLQGLAAEGGFAADYRCVGFVTNPYAAMRAAGVVALSSRYEGFGNVLVEAMACGTPVVATDCPGGVAEILDGGRYGRLTPVGDAPALARALAETLDDPLPGSALKMRARAFSPEAAAEAWLRLIDGLE